MYYIIISFNKMISKYIIQIDQNDAYPFDGTKAHSQSIQVHLQMISSTLSDFESNHKKIQILLSLNYQRLIKIISVIQIKNKSFTLVYQYIPTSFISIKTKPVINKKQLQETLKHYSQILINKNIKYEILIEHIGINYLNQIKFYLNNRFQIIKKTEKEYLQKYYEEVIDKILSNYFESISTIKSADDLQRISRNIQQPEKVLGYQFMDKRINEFEDRLKRIYNKSPKQKSKNNVNNNIVLQSLTNRQKYNNSFNGLVSNSFIYDNNLSKAKIHKSSFGDYSTNSNKLNQSTTSKQDSLTKRITTALEKTQEAFKFYQKFTRKHKRL